MNSELREAAERRRQQYANKADYVYCHKFPGHEMAIDIATVLSDALKKIQPDDNEPVDLNWLQGLDIDDNYYQYSEQMPTCLSLYSDYFDIDIESMEGKPITRGQVRLLLRALG